MQSDPLNTGGALDGSAAAAIRCVGELAALAGQDADSGVLELRLEEILTRTSVHAASACLVVTAQIAGTAEAGTPPSRAVVLATGLPGGLELQWDAVAGRTLAVRRIALRALADERALLDAILETADLAAERLGGGAP